MHAVVSKRHKVSISMLRRVCNVTQALPKHISRTGVPVHLHVHVDQHVCVVRARHTEAQLRLVDDPPLFGFELLLVTIVGHLERKASHALPDLDVHLSSPSDMPPDGVDLVLDEVTDVVLHETTRAVTADAV